ncbi:MAG: pentapeptide repeat-containing protein, partial [Lachnospiraceae bacterium]|nr:pentapeptide repeat-containing protein [Lachnospiraceae bacterium]
MGKKTKVTVETMAFESNELKMSSVSETMTADNNMLKGAALEKSTLGKASFEKASFEKSFLGEASFENASVEKSYFSEPSLEKASFESVSLGSSSMEKGSLKEVSFVELKDGDSFTMVDKSLVSETKEAQFEVADATEEDFFGSFLEVEDTEDYEMQLMEQLQMIWFLQNYALME